MSHTHLYLCDEVIYVDYLILIMFSILLDWLILIRLNLEKRALGELPVLV